MRFLLEGVLVDNPLQLFIKSSEPGVGWIFGVGKTLVDTESDTLAELTEWVKKIFHDVLWHYTDMVSTISYAIDSSEWEQVDGEDGEDGDPVLCIYLTTVTSSTPSGKLYMPWANSNVSLIEAAQDELYAELVGRHFDNLDGYWIERGEGSMNDILLFKNIPEVTE
jgi:hypothetical protein